MENRIVSAMDWALQVDQAMRNHESETVREVWTEKAFISPLHAIMDFAERGIRQAIAESE